MIFNKLFEWFILFLKKYIVLFACFSLLFINFYSNVISTAPDMSTFKNFDRISNDLIIVNLIHDKLYDKDNIILQASDEQGNYDFLSDYNQNKPIDEKMFFNYYSQIGLHGQAYVLLDKFLPLSPQNTLKLIYIFNSAMLAFCLSIFIYWIRRKLGLFPAALVFVFATFLSPDLTNFGRHLYWAGWTLFIPLIGSIFVVQSKFFERKYKNLFSFLIVFFSCLIKFMCYFEFTSTILISAMIPFVFYVFSKGKSIKEIFTTCIFPAIAAVFAFVVACIYKIILIANVEHSLSRSIDIFKSPISYRLTGEANNSNPLLAASATTSTIQVLNTYISRPAFKLFQLNITYKELIIFFILFGVLGFICAKNLKIDNITQKTIYALITSTCISIIAPLSWYILAKPHAFIHTEQCSVLWDIPFVLFGFALIGYVVSVFSKIILKNSNSLKD